GTRKARAWSRSSASPAAASPRGTWTRSRQPTLPSGSCPGPDKTYGGGASGRLSIQPASRRAGGSFEPVVEVDLGAFAQVGSESALTAQPGQLPGPRLGDDEPIPADDVAGHGAGVLEQERPLPPAELAGNPLDAHEAGRPVGPGRLQELHDAIACDVAGEALLNVNPRQCLPVGRLVVGRWLVLVDGDDRSRAGPLRAVAHATTSSSGVNRAGVAGRPAGRPCLVPGCWRGPNRSRGNG